MHLDSPIQMRDDAQDQYKRRENSMSRSLSSSMTVLLALGLVTTGVATEASVPVATTPAGNLKVVVHYDSGSGPVGATPL